MDINSKINNITVASNGTVSFADVELKVHFYQMNDEGENVSYRFDVQLDDYYFTEHSGDIVAWRLADHPEFEDLDSDIVREIEENFSSQLIERIGYQQRLEDSYPSLDVENGEIHEVRRDGNDFLVMQDMTMRDYHVYFQDEVRYSLEDIADDTTLFTFCSYQDILDNDEILEILSRNSDLVEHDNVPIEVLQDYAIEYDDFDFISNLSYSRVQEMKELESENSKLFAHFTIGKGIELPDEIKPEPEQQKEIQPTI